MPTQLLDASLKSDLMFSNPPFTQMHLTVVTYPATGLWRPSGLFFFLLLLVFFKYDLKGQLLRGEYVPQKTAYGLHLLEL